MPENNNIRNMFYYRRYHKINKLLGVDNDLCIKTEKASVADSYVLAPIMNIFVLWILKNAKKKGIERLYFLARDGYSACLLARKYCEAFNLEIECIYLYCSRFSVRMPMYSENISEALDYICRGGIDVTWEKIFQRSGLENWEMEWVLSCFDKKIDLQESISSYELKKIKIMLLKCERFIGLLKEKSNKSWENIQGYFEQEGLLTEDKIAIVDSGWTGTTQKSINDIRKKAGCTAEIEGYYFGLYEVPVDSDTSRYHSFYFSPHKGLWNKVFFCNCFFETVFSAFHGTTVGYRKEKESYKPILGLESMENEKKILVLNKELDNYAMIILGNLNKKSFEGLKITKLRKLIQPSIKKLMCRPKMQEAEYYGTLLFSDDLLDSNKQELAVELSDKQLSENHCINKILTAVGVRTGQIKESAWYEGSAVRNGSHSNWHCISFSFYKVIMYIAKLIK